MKQWPAYALILLTGLAVVSSLSASADADDARAISDEGRLSTITLVAGLSEIVEWPCGPAEYFGFLQDDLAAVSCEPGPTADFAFVDLNTGNAIRQIEGPPSGIVLTSGLWTIDGEDYWAQIIGRHNLNLVMPGQAPEIRLYHPDPTRDRHLSLSGLATGQFSDAYINGIAGCAMLEEPIRTADGSVSSRLRLVDIANVVTSDQLAERSLAVEAVEFGHPPSRAALISTPGPMLSASCYRENESLVFLVSEQRNSGARISSTNQLSRIALSAEPAVLSYDSIDIDAFRWTSLFRPTTANALSIAVTPRGSARLSDMPVLEVGAANLPMQQAAEPLPVGWRWIHFDSASQTGLGIPTDYRSQGRELLLASCREGRCEVWAQEIRLDGPAAFMGIGRIHNHQVFRSCISLSEDADCRETTILISIPDLARN